MGQQATSQELPDMKEATMRRPQMAKKKSAAPIRYVVKYEIDGSPHYGAIQINGGDRLSLETSHGSKTAPLTLPPSFIQA
jgi:hypothetical protein